MEIVGGVSSIVMLDLCFLSGDGTFISVDEVENKNTIFFKILKRKNENF